MADLRQSGYGGRDVRFFLLGMNYRKPISYSENALRMAGNTVKKMDTLISRLRAVSHSANDFPEVDQLIYDLNHGFEHALDDDLNISGALAALFDFIGAVNTPLAGGKISRQDASKILEALQKINDVLQIFEFKEQIDDRGIRELIQKREAARQAGLWEEADSLRNRLAGLGVEVLDSPQGTIWHFR
jgi:cysteinyl-tRNA synthetase